MGSKRTYEQEAYQYWYEQWQAMMAKGLSRRLIVKAGTIAGLGGWSTLNVLIAACANRGAQIRDEVQAMLAEGQYQYSPFPLADRYHWKRLVWKDPPYYGGHLQHTASSPPSWDGLRTGGNTAYGGVSFQTLLTLKRGPETNFDKVELINQMVDDFAPSPDLGVWTGKLHPGIYFHGWEDGFQEAYPGAVDSRECTADDVVQSFRAHAALGAYAGQLGFVDRFEVVDRYTFRIHMKRPVLFLPATIASPYFWIYRPEDIEMSQKEPEKFAWRPIGTGPFKVKFSKFNDRLIARPHERYWTKDAPPGRRLPYLGKWEGYYAPDIATTKSLFRTGQIDLISTGEVTVLEDILATNPQSMVQVTAVSPSFHQMIVLQHKNPLFQDVRVRRALSMALDRNLIIQQVLGGGGVPDYPVPFSMMGLDRPLTLEECGPYWQYNPQEAKRLLSEAGYPNGIEFSMMVPAPVSDVWLLVAEQWKQIGVRVRFDERESSVVCAAPFQKQFPDALVSSIERYFIWTRGYDLDQYVYNAMKTGGGENFGNYSDPILDELVEKQRFSLDADERTKIAKQINDRWLDQVPYIHLYSPYQIWIRQPWFWNSADHMFGQFWCWYSQQMGFVFIDDQAPGDRKGTRA